MNYEDNKLSKFLEGCITTSGSELYYHLIENKVNVETICPEYPKDKMLDSLLDAYDNAFSKERYGVLHECMAHPIYRVLFIIIYNAIQIRS